jgi:hypothetical protein
MPDLAIYQALNGLRRRAGYNVTSVVVVRLEDRVLLPALTCCVQQSLGDGRFVVAFGEATLTGYQLGV